MKLRKVGIIGVGHVGAHVLSALVTQGVADEVVLVDKNPDKSACECQDIKDSMMYMPHRVHVSVGDFSDLGDCDIIVNSSGQVSVLIGQTDRKAEMKITVPALNDFVPKIKASGFDGVFVDVSNPCDVVTRKIAKGLGLPKGRVIGTGTGLDTARLVSILAEKTGVDHKSITAYMIGEHGNEQFAPWSQVYFGSHSIDELAEKDSRFQFDREEMSHAAMRGGWVVFKGKHCTEYAIAATAVRIIKAVLHDEHVVIPVTTDLDGAYGEHDIFAGVPAVIGKNGCEEVLELKLTDEELARFHKCCDHIRENIKAADEL